MWSHSAFNSHHTGSILYQLSINLLPSSSPPPPSILSLLLLLYLSSLCEMEAMIHELGNVCLASKGHYLCVKVYELTPIWLQTDDESTTSQSYIVLSSSHHHPLHRPIRLTSLESMKDVSSAWTSMTYRPSVSHLDKMKKHHGLPISLYWSFYWRLSDQPCINT